MRAERTIFVFGSNLAGRHGAGSALYARREWGAKQGVGVGLTGNAYAIPTKDASLHTLSLITVAQHVKDFLGFAHARPTWHFHLVAIGCGLAGWRPIDIAPMFKNAPPNVELPPEFRTSHDQT